ncbi:MAG: RimK family protein [Gammaproteobacteria bacterium]|nr:MAG: RimK family protein [Gammaproteobacteria bacterium]
MATLIVVDEPRDWPLQIPSAEVVAARSYLTDGRFSGLRRPRVYNLCESYAYQATGYYVSLLAAARGHRPLPDVLTMQDIKSPALIRPTEELEELMQKALQERNEERFDLSVYFGHHPEPRFQRLAQALFNVFPVPLLRASFLRRPKWRLQGLRPIPVGDIPAEQREFLRGAIEQHFARRMPAPKAPAVRYELAILVNAADRSPPSDPPAIRRFERAAEAHGFEVEVIGPDDFGRLAEFDALFIRETTQVNHHTYRFASRARNEGLIVIDDPDSIVRCANKVYLAELMTRLGIPMPKTLIVHRNNIDRVEAELGLPCVLKKPDSSFSQGVVKVQDPVALRLALRQLLERSDLVIAQEYLPTPFDWRVGVLDRKPLYVCRYYMARNHWQIYKQQAGGRLTGGRWDTLRVDEAPPAVVELGMRAADAIGDGFYGVDIKEVDGRCLVMEVNDNPSVERSVEDQVLGDALYEAVMRVFRTRLELARVSGNGR